MSILTKLFFPLIGGEKWCRVGTDPFGSDAVHYAIARVIHGSVYERRNTIRIKSQQLAWLVYAVSEYLLYVLIK